MAELKHIKTFESYSISEEVEQVNEELFDSRKKKVDKYLKNPEEGKADKLLSSLFSKTFTANTDLKDEIMKLPHEEKVEILKKASDILSDPKIGVLKLQKRAGEYLVGGVGYVAGSGGGRKG
jgi:hypothetical protein